MYGFHRNDADWCNKQGFSRSNVHGSSFRGLWCGLLLLSKASWAQMCMDHLFYGRACLEICDINTTGVYTDSN